ncbi:MULTISPECIES: hypothetical protein [unclassified Viridibacillus]|uniref:hypothetical protein n=1 Tax=unclassified Viridibacillus TaxID=2617942 RepID=UPI00096D1F13|nr:MULTISPECIES: hypothetical protein [unclassified Viridibacillus]OMC83939.1 hypothetical protein BK130_05375 [Viridibacillus sp. FSL H8-0123]OMC88461.1 hypothetical protein BK128_00495 [Viridibacillus sp. FSL H7-0596]
MVVKHLKKSYLLITFFILSVFILVACSSDKESTKDQSDDLNQSTSRLKSMIKFINTRRLEPITAGALTNQRES